MNQAQQQLAATPELMAGGGAVTNTTAFDFEWGCARALEVMLEQLQSQLQAFTTSYAEDLADLNGPFTGYNNWVSVTARVRYKRILIKLEEELRCVPPPTHTHISTKPNQTPPGPYLTSIIPPPVAWDLTAPPPPAAPATTTAAANAAARRC